MEIQHIREKLSLCNSNELESHYLVQSLESQMS